MKKYFLLIFLSFLLISNKSIGQDSLIINPYSVLIGNDTLPAGSTDSISFWVYNIASTPFNDSIKLFTSVQDSIFTFIYNPIDTVDFGPIVIPAYDSTQFTLYNFYDIAPTRFHYDINVIVIWPAASSLSFYDSLFYNQFITIANGVDEIDLLHLIKAYPNPAINKITLENEGENNIEEVRIYDSKGRLVESLNKPEFICTEAWVPGMYLINIQLKDGKTHTIRVVKQ